MLLNPNADEIARIAVDEEVKVVITGAGNSKSSNYRSR